MTEVLPTSVVILLGLILTAVLNRRFDSAERKVIFLGFGAHVAAAFLQVWITRYYYGGGDMFMYLEYGQNLTSWLAAAPGARFGDVLRIIAQQDVRVAVPLYGGPGTSTASMIGITSLGLYIFEGSLYAICLLFSFGSFFGQLAIYVGLKRCLAPRFHRRLAIAALLVPSVVFWSSAILKESFAMGGVGLVFLAMQGLIHKRDRTRNLLLLVLGAIPIGLVKSYILFPMLIAFGIWFYWQRSLQSRGQVAILKRPIYLAIGLVVAVGSVVLLGELFPRYSFANLGNELAHLQYHGQRAGGGSVYQLGDPSQRSLLGQLAFVPIGLFTALFRPLVFEAHNLASFVNALESTAITGAVVWIVWRRGLKNTIQLILKSPTAMFIIVFVLLFSTAVGLGSPNLGTVSRYRIPMMPFYVALVFILVPTRGRKA